MSPQKEFGDFQTPLSLARRVMSLVNSKERGIRTVIEPTCGVGAFLQASTELFGKTSTYIGFDLNGEHVSAARNSLPRTDLHAVLIEQRDFYDIHWKEFLHEQKETLLVVGNPPWITNSGMGAIGGKNLPAKSNFQGHGGLAAKTGKANFDISEWMLLRLLEALQGTRAAIAMLCKTATARKVLRHAWLMGWNTGPSSLHLIDATAEFGVSVDACLFYTHTGTKTSESSATVYRTLSFDDPMQTFGLIAGELVSDVGTYRELYDLDGLEYRRWRSGVKHDAAKVMEFTRENHEFVNGLGERFKIEEDYVFPLLKSSDLANGRLRPSRCVLLTQCKVNESTDDIKHRAPKTWRYLNDHAHQLDKRGSSIYANRARFSVFGVGDYTFAPAKVAVSGLYKNFRFQAVGCAGKKPIVVDDTCYFIPCESKSEAEFFAKLLNAETAQRFLKALAFTDAKRPLTVDVLKRIDLKKLAEHADLAATAAEYLSSQPLEENRQRLLVFEKPGKYGRERSTKSRRSIGRP